MKAQGERRARRQKSSEAGMVSAEFALTLPAVGMMLVVVLVAGATGVGQVRAVEAAYAAGRAMASGEGQAVAQSLAQRITGPGAQIQISTDGQGVNVQVVKPIPGLGWLGGLSARANAQVPAEAVQ